MTVKELCDKYDRAEIRRLTVTIECNDTVVISNRVYHTIPRNIWNMTVAQFSVPEQNELYIEVV